MSSQLTQSSLTSSPYHFVPIPFQGEEDTEEGKASTTSMTTSEQPQQVIISPSSTVAATFLHAYDLSPSSSSSSSSSSYMTPKKTDGKSSDNACSGFDAAAAAITPPPPPPPALHHGEGGAATTSFESIQKILFPILGDDDGSMTITKWCGVKRHSGSIIINNNNNDLDLPSFKLLPRRNSQKTEESTIENYMHQSNKKQRKQLQQGGDKDDNVSFSLSLPLF